MEGAALAGAGQRDRPRKGGKRTKASKAQELFEEEVKRLVKLIDVKLTLQGLRNVVEYEEALKSALASSALDVTRGATYSPSGRRRWCRRGRRCRRGGRPSTQEQELVGLGRGKGAGG